MAEKCETLQDLYTWCLNSHYKLNDHHPQHFQNPDEEMSLQAKIELTCDLLACVLGVFKKYNISVPLSECRYIIENDKWPTWKYAQKEFLPISSDLAPKMILRWKKFPNEEKEKLKELFEKFKQGQPILNELKKLESVQFYLTDLDYHKEAVKEVWKQISEFNIDNMEHRINHHDDDKLEPIMILGYTANWCFKD